MIIILCVFIIAAIFIADNHIKNYVEENFEYGVRKNYLHGKISLNRVHNRGFAGGRAEKHRGLVVFTAVMITFIGIGIFVLSIGNHGNNFMRIGLSFLLGGAFSNTYDRLKRKFVVDYISFNVKHNYLSRIVFNISDFAIIMGSLIAMFGAV